MILRLDPGTRWRLCVSLLLLGVGAFLLVGLLPFTFDFDRPLRIYRGYGSPINNALNFLCFLPIGALVAALVRRKPVLTAAVAAFVLSATVEVLQVFLPERYPSIADLVLNSLGAATGGWLLVRRTGARRIEDEGPQHEH